jgi:hypothetical protein
MHVDVASPLYAHGRSLPSIGKNHAPFNAWSFVYILLWEFYWSMSLVFPVLHKVLNEGNRVDDGWRILIHSVWY